ncbi:ATP-dependent Clp protease adaptor ClpS [bacterium]|nr:ATP-dependent Clp protease adaptor ClpS [bacterium]
MPSPDRKGVALPEVSEQEETRLAPRYRVLVHNDDVTPMDFVVGILRSVFGLSVAQSVAVMLRAHTGSVAHVTTLALEEAEVRCEKAHGLARAKRYPLTFTYEPE